MSASFPVRAPRALGVARRAALVFAAWSGFWLLSAGIIALLLYVPYAQMRYGELGVGGMLAILAAISLIVALFRPRGAERGTRGQALARERVPALYAQVEAIGARAGVRAPVAIHLGAGINASVGAERHWYGRVRRLDVTLGHGLLCVLDERQLGAVIAHEFGHMAKGDLGLTPWVYRTRIALGGTLSSLESSLFLLDAPFRLYAHGFLRQTASISRAQEYAADALGAEMFGADAMAGALRQVHAFDAEWSVYFNEALLPAVNRGARLPVLEGFRRFSASTDKRPSVLQALARADAEAPHPFDSHPSLEERLMALGASAGSDLPGSGGALHLLGGEAEAERLWYECFTRGMLCDTDWEAFGEAVLAPAIQARFSGTFLSPEEVPLRKLPELVADTEALWQRTKPDGLSLLSAQGRTRHVMGVLEEFVIASLGRCGWRLRAWPGELLSLERGAERISPERLIVDVCQGRVGADTLARYETRTGSVCDQMPMRAGHEPSG